MTEVNIVMDDYGLLYAILPDGSERQILADVYNSMYYGVVRLETEPKEE